MKKYILASLLFIGCIIFSFAQVHTNSKALSAKIIMTSGEVLETTLIPFPIKFDLNYIKVKEGDRIRKIKKKNIEKMFVENDVYVNKNVYSPSGKRILKNKKLLRVVVLGKVNLYCDTYTVQEPDPFANGPIFFKRNVYYCQKDSEDAATMIHYDFDNFNKNDGFKTAAANYFSDNESITEKIKNETFTYKDVVAVVEEYNK
ncbi:hypothetical protein GR160_18495 [Flavobacterium sp. Sd200]|uniref:hypothetical protein n=1 Tax=Flavobacterium sp. Sd200 TaxID=2692211 RepID=UPI00136BC793|nr:hypothetical protein [Flavobacterium sp. Sd200]MXN93223.1 hypothetical protein [Flavobacterium sp. Sd200]